MFRRRINRDVPTLNTTSTADISFVLLILFLVTTSLDPDKGLMRILPSLSTEETVEPSQIKDRNLFDIKIDSEGTFHCKGKIVSGKEMEIMLSDFIDNPSASDTLPEKTMVNIPPFGNCMITKNHIISVETHRSAPYNKYFEVHDIIDKVYHKLRNKLAIRKFGFTYAACSDKQREAVDKYYPQHISEVYNTIDKNTEI